MKDPLFNTLSVLAVLGILLVAGLLAAGAGDRGQAQAGQRDLAEAPAAEGNRPEAAEAELAPQRKTRRARASLSMPYFSFAQSLRPGG